MRAPKVSYKELFNSYPELKYQICQLVDLGASPEDLASKLKVTKKAIMGWHDQLYIEKAEEGYDESKKVQNEVVKKIEKLELESPSRIRLLSRKTRKAFRLSKELRDRVCRLVDKGYPATFVASELGLCARTIQNWRDQSDNHKANRKRLKRQANEVEKALSSLSKKLS